MKLQTNLSMADILYALYDYACTQVDRRTNNNDFVRIDQFNIQLACTDAASRRNFWFGTVFFGVWELRLDVDLSELPLIDVSGFDMLYGYGAEQTRDGRYIRTGRSGAALDAISIFIRQKRFANNYYVNEYIEPTATLARPSSALWKLPSFTPSSPTFAASDEPASKNVSPTKSATFGRRISLTLSSTSPRQLFAWAASSNRNLENTSPVSLPGGSEESSRTATPFTPPVGDPPREQLTMSPITLSGKFKKKA